MNFKRGGKARAREEIFINLTSLIDIILILLIFFMLTSNFAQDKNLSVNLPAASSATSKPDNLALVIGIDNNGLYHINNKQLADNKRQTLLVAIQQSLAARAPATQTPAQQIANSDIPVQLSGDAKAPNQAVVTALDVLGELGFAKVQIATTPESGHS